MELNNIRLRRLQNFQTEPLGAIMVTPLLVPHRDEFSETVGYIILGPSRSALFIPDINKWELWDRNIHDEIRNVDYAFVDATFFDGDELPGRDMSEIPHPFVVESMALFAPLPETEKRKIWFIHMNHSNPLLDPDSTAYQTVTGAGFNVAGEGMRFSALTRRPGRLIICFSAYPASPGTGRIPVTSRYHDAGNFWYCSIRT